jgi:hypothetical protein
MMRSLLLNDGDPATSTDLEVTAPWLMPIMESPSYHGDHVANHYEVDADYGTSANFQRLVDERTRTQMMGALAAFGTLVLRITPT